MILTMIFHLIIKIVPIYHFTKEIDHLNINFTIFWYMFLKNVCIAHCHNCSFGGNKTHSTCMLQQIIVKVVFRIIHIKPISYDTV